MLEENGFDDIFRAHDPVNGGPFIDIYKEGKSDVSVGNAMTNVLYTR